MYDTKNNPCIFAKYYFLQCWFFSSNWISGSFWSVVCWLSLSFSLKQTATNSLILWDIYNALIIVLDNCMGNRISDYVLYFITSMQKVLVHYIHCCRCLNCLTMLSVSFCYETSGSSQSEEHVSDWVPLKRILLSALFLHNFDHTHICNVLK